MSLISLQSAQRDSMLIGPLARLKMMMWGQHYQAETVDLRYFFHSGWSS
ncbi:hypothetical protein ABFY09_05925 [Marinomonas sp. 5E14-1]